MFIRLATMGAVSAFFISWNLLTSRNKLLSEKPVTTRINTTKLGTGIYWFDNFLLVKSAGSIQVFSNRCTHAGCRINQEIEGELVCPCHGSRYDASTGQVIQGPARLPLPNIPFVTDPKTAEIIFKI